MTELDFTFEEPTWIAALDSFGRTISATQFLALLEGESEDALEEAFLHLESSHITLDIGDLPKATGFGQAAVRLHREEELVKNGTLRQNLEENDPLRLYLEEVDANPVSGDLQVFAQQFAGGYEAAMQKLTESMLPTVIDMAQQFTGYGVLLLDLIQEGSLGLWQGILSYQQGDFMQHAHWWVHQYMAKAVTMQAREQGVGQKMKQAMEDYRSVDEKLLSDLGRNPTLEEIAEEMHMSLEETEAAFQMLENARRLQLAKSEEKPEEEEDPEEQQAVENTAFFQMRQRISDLLSVLDEQDAKLLSLRFGLEGGLPLTPEEVGMKLHLTAEQVVAREAAALQKLRNEG